MDISSSFGTASATSGGGSAGTTPQQSDYQTFLNMLTVQMRNQDPLNPASATDFAVQLATFSGVEQQSYTNQLLSSLLSQSGLSDLGSWVGMEARLYGGAWYEGTPIELSPAPAPAADAATLVVRDGTGAVVDSRSLDPETQRYVWDGLDGDGNPLPDGTYTFQIESLANGEVIDTQPVAAYVPILEARYEDGMTKLVMPGDLWVNSSDVSGLRRPG